MPEAETAAPNKGSKETDAAIKGATDAASSEAMSKAVMEQIQHVVKSEMGGLIKRQLAESLKSEDFIKSIGATFREASAPKVEPTPDSKEKERLEIIERRLNEEVKARREAEGIAREQTLKGGIQDAINSLNGADGKPKVRDDARGDLAVLLSGGHGLPGKPELDEQGKVIVKLADGVVRPLADILSDGYFGDSHWALSKFAARGSGGGRGADGSQSATAGLKEISSRDGRRQFQELASKDPQAAIDEAVRLKEAAAARMGIRGRR